MEQIIINGNSAAAFGALLSRVQVTAAYPISPQTGIVEALADFVTSGRLEAKFIMSESEHSVMASLIAASEAGARVFTATSSQGLALMHELLHWAAGARLPIVMVNVNRAMSAPWTMYCDQSDIVAQRDTGWLHVYCEGNQETLDAIIQGYKVAEQVMLPVLVNMDGFYNSYTTEPVIIDDIEAVDRFLPPYDPPVKLDPEEPHTLHGGTGPPLFMEMRYQMWQAMEHALTVARQADEEFESLFGRRYGLTEAYRCEDAELILVSSGSLVGTLREVIDDYRERGETVGLLKIRYLRPFPTQEVRQALAPARQIAVIDRNVSVGMGGVFWQEVRSALYGSPIADTPVLGFIAGIGGRDVTPKSVAQIIQLARSNPPQDVPIWVELKA
ncbi:MAG: pyruvate ferredoxin oxidoreductase [Chloroflexota bacterium]